MVLKAPPFSSAAAGWNRVRPGAAVPVFSPHHPLPVSNPSISSTSSSTAAIVGIVAVLAIVLIVYFSFLRGADGSGTDIDVNIDPSDAVESVTPDGE